MADSYIKIPVVVSATDTTPAGTVVDAPKGWSGTAWSQRDNVVLGASGYLGITTAGTSPTSGRVRLAYAAGTASWVRWMPGAATEADMLSQINSTARFGDHTLNSANTLIAGVSVEVNINAVGTYVKFIGSRQVDLVSVGGTASTQNGISSRKHGLVTTTDAATATAVTGMTLTLSANSAVGGEVRLVARNTADDTATIVYFRFSAHRAAGGAVLDASLASVAVGAAGLATVSAAAVASGNTIEIRVNGVAATTIDWQGRVEAEEN